MKSLIITTDLRLLVRQDFHDASLDQVQEIYRGPHGRCVRFTVTLHSDPKNTAGDFALAEVLCENRWQPLVKMFHGNLPPDTGTAMTWLMASVGAILEWSGMGLEAA